MRKRLAVTVTLLVIGVMLIPGAVAALPEDELWENHLPTTDSNITIYGNNYAAQTFTVDPESHSVNRIIVEGFRTGYPGTVTISIRECDDSGDPLFEDLSSGTFDADLTSNTTANFHGCLLTDYSLEYGEQYAIVISAEDGDADNYFMVREDGSAATYDGGSSGTSTNGGLNWSMDADDDLYFAVYGQELIELSDAKVFTGYLEDEDMLFTMAYYDLYVPQYPESEPRTSFWLQLREIDGTTILAQTTLLAWGYRPGSIYLSANQCESLVIGAEYQIWLIGTMAEAPSDSYTLAASDWMGSPSSFLDSWVITWAKEIAQYYDTDMTTYINEGEVLNEVGSVLFANGIPALITIRPDIFQSSTYEPDYDAGTTTHPYESSTTWDAVLGTSATTALTSIGNIVGLSGRHVGAYGLILLYGLLCLLIAAKGGNGLIGAILGVPIIVAGAWLHLIDIAFVCIVAGIAVLMTMFRFWFSRT